MVVTEKQLAPGTLRRAYEGARHAVIPGFGAGAIVGLLSGIPVILSAGAGAILGMTAGVLLALARR